MVCTVSPSARYVLHGNPQREIWFAPYPTARGIVSAVLPKGEVWFTRYPQARGMFCTVSRSGRCGLSSSSPQNLSDFATVNHSEEEVIFFYLVTYFLNGDNYMPRNIWQP